jgi:hypothetical protein
MLVAPRGLLAHQSFIMMLGSLKARYTNRAFTNLTQNMMNHEDDVADEGFHAVANGHMTMSI